MATYLEELGARLRAVRHWRGLSLESVQVLSEGRFHPSTVGSWERGTRAVTVERLAELAGLYGVPAADLIVPAPQGQVDG